MKMGSLSSWFDSLRTSGLFTEQKPFGPLRINSATEESKPWANKTLGVSAAVTP